MSRIAKKPITIPKGVEFHMSDREVTLKGPKGSLKHRVPENVEVDHQGNSLTFKFKVDEASARMAAGTTRALLNNMVIGVSQGFTKKLELVGVGYRAQAQGKKLNLTLGYSHPVAMEMPEGIVVETPSQTEILVKGTDKQMVGLIASKIRAKRAPEPYKGKGVKYANEVLTLKEAKKK